MPVPKSPDVTSSSQIKKGENEVCANVEMLVPCNTNVTFKNKSAAIFLYQNLILFYSIYKNLPLKLHLFFMNIFPSFSQKVSSVDEELKGRRRHSNSQTGPAQPPKRSCMEKVRHKDKIQMSSGAYA